MPRRSKTPVHRLRRSPPFFHPVPLRTRRDGWTVARQCEFLAQLYVTGSVAAAARSVGMSRNSAYRLRARDGAEGFASAWDHVLTPPGSGHSGKIRRDFRKVTDLDLLRRLDVGLVQPLLYRGQFVGIRRKPCEATLFRLLGRMDGRARLVPGRAAHG